MNKHFFHHFSPLKPINKGKYTDIGSELILCSVQYDLFYTTTFILNCIYMNLYQFLETGTSDKCLICIVQLLRFSGFSLYPISFFFYSPFKEWQWTLYIIDHNYILYISCIQISLFINHNVVTRIQWNYCHLYNFCSIHI